MKDKKLTVVGDVDPIDLVKKLKKLCHAELLSVGPAKEPEKKRMTRKMMIRRKSNRFKILLRPIRNTIPLLCTNMFITVPRRIQMHVLYLNGNIL